jgi:hypothetical protein
LPEFRKAEVLDLIEYLKSKAGEKEWSEFWLSSAMCGMEDELSLYSLEDLKKSFS